MLNQAFCYAGKPASQAAFGAGRYAGAKLGAGLVVCRRVSGVFRATISVDVEDDGPPAVLDILEPKKAFWERILAGYVNGLATSTVLMILKFWAPGDWLSIALSLSCVRMITCSLKPYDGDSFGMMIIYFDLRNHL
jgi:hypothetical protein